MTLNNNLNGNSQTNSCSLSKNKNSQTIKNKTYDNNKV